MLPTGIKGLAQPFDKSKTYQPYMPSDDLAVVSTALYRIIGPYGAKWEIIFAGIIICIIPSLIIFLVLQKSIYSNLVTGSVKE